MAFTNERDKKGRLSFVYNSDDSAETIREIVEDCQKKVIGASTRRTHAAAQRCGRARGCGARIVLADSSRRSPVASFRPLAAMMKAQNNDQPPRYKFVFQASMGENNNQMIRNASRCLWDSDIDNCASASWTNGRVYAVAMCFALYYE